MRRAPFKVSILATLAVLVVVAQVRAAELVMMEQPGCPWCVRFEAEIAPAYAKTPEGHIAPLRRVDITGTWPADLQGIAPSHFTPTFVLIDNGNEVTRMRGYPGDQFFWFLLDEMLKKLPARAARISG